MARKRPPIVDLEDTVETINMAIYGDPGIGKTVQAGTLPNNLILSTDVSGTVSAKRQGSKAKLLPVGSWDELSDAYEWLKSGGTEEFDWVTIDTGTKMQELCIRGILDTVVAANSERSLDIPALADHQSWQNRFKRFVDLFVALPVNTLFVFHVMTVEDEEGEEVRLPQLQGGKSWVAIARSLPARFSVMGFMQERVVSFTDPDTDSKKSKRVRRIHWQPGKNHMAKDRYDCLGRHTDDVPLKLIADRILGEGQQAKAPAEPLKAAAKAAPRKAATKAARTTSTTRKATPVRAEEDDD